MAPRLLKSHDVVMIGGIGGVTIWGGKMDWSHDGKSAPVYPTLGETSGKDVFPYFQERNKFDVAITLWDSFSVHWITETPVPAICYIPIDAPMTRRMADYVKNAYKIVAMSHFGFRQLERFYPPSKISMIEHGVDTNVFKPDPALREMGRKNLYCNKEKLPENAFIAVDVATNIGERKNLPFLIHCFKEFADRHKDAYLLLYTNMRMSYPNGYDLDVYADEVGLKNIIFLNNNPIIDPLDDNVMNIIYNVGDVLMNPSHGEGFGLPYLEAMAAGLPPIGTNSSATTELLQDGRGWLIDTVKDWVDIPNWIPTLQSYFPPSKASLLACLEDAYSNPGKIYEFSQKCREYALKHDWERDILPKWFELLEEAEGDIKVLNTLSA